MLQHYNLRIEDIDSYDTFTTHSRATITSKKKFVRILCRSPITKKLLRLYSRDPITPKTDLYKTNLQDKPNTQAVTPYRYLLFTLPPLLSLNLALILSLSLPLFSVSFFSLHPTYPRISIRKAPGFEESQGAA